MVWLSIFFFVPIAEMYLLMTVAGYLEIWPTLGLVILTAVVGVSLLKRQGLATLSRGMQRFNGGQMPGMEIMEGLCLAIAGALLVTPGLLTDVIGFALLWPRTRQWLAGRLLARMLTRAAGGQAFGETGRSGQATSTGRPSAPVVLEGDYEHKSDSSR